MSLNCRQFDCLVGKHYGDLVDDWIKPIAGVADESRVERPGEALAGEIDGGASVDRAVDFCDRLGGREFQPRTVLGAAEDVDQLGVHRSRTLSLVWLLAGVQHSSSKPSFYGDGPPAASVRERLKPDNPLYRYED